MDIDNPNLSFRQPNPQIREARLTDPGGLSSPTVNPVFGSQAQLIQYLHRKFQRFAGGKLDTRSAGRFIIRELQAQASASGNVEEEVKRLTEIINEAMNRKQQIPAGLTAIEVTMFMTSQRFYMRYLCETLIRTYTAETFLYKHLNQVLRSGKWEKIDSLIAYLYYLMEACKEFAPTSDMIQPKQVNSVKPDPDLILYRGVTLTKDQVAQYDKKNCEKFSWNGITSTSLDKNIAVMFLNQQNSPDECPVLFTILYYKKAETVRFLQFCDVSGQSEFAAEREIIIIPGTVFKLVETYQEKGIYHITLEVLDEEIPNSKAASLFCLEDIQLQIKEKSNQLYIGCLQEGDVEEVIDIFSKGNDFTDEIRFRYCSFGLDSMTRLITSFLCFSNLQYLTVSCSEPRFWTPEMAQAFTQNLPESPKISLYLNLVEYTSSSNVINEIISSGIYKKFNTFTVSLPTFDDIMKRFNIMKGLAALPEGVLTELAVVGFSFEEDEGLVTTFWALLAAIDFVHLTVSHQHIQANSNITALCNYIAISKIKHLYLRCEKKFDLDALKLICDTLPGCALETLWICKYNDIQNATEHFGYQGIDLLASALEGSKIKSLGLFGIREELESMMRLMDAIPFTHIKNFYLNVQLLQKDQNNTVERTEKMKMLTENLGEIKATLKEAVVYCHIGSEKFYSDKVIYSFDGQPVEPAKTLGPSSWVRLAKDDLLKRLQQKKDENETSIGYRNCEDNVFKRIRFNSWMFTRDCKITPWDEDFVHDRESKI